MGTIKIERVYGRHRQGTQQYKVILTRGTEEELISKLNGDLNNLIKLCDNGGNFEDTVDRTYGGYVTKGYVNPKVESDGKISYKTFIQTNSPDP